MTWHRDAVVGARERREKWNIPVVFSHARCHTTNGVPASDGGLLALSLFLCLSLSRRFAAVANEEKKEEGSGGGERRETKRNNNNNNNKYSGQLVIRLFGQTCVRVCNGLYL